ncbi:MAG: histidine phosphatase family protein [Ruminococcaceae bacterium]|nr:histidine phosphatase family protein [Oscillospiraceae bacterium]
MTTFYLIRHGQTDTNIYGGFNGSLNDQPLNEVGLKMVAGLTAVFEDVPLDAIYVSPLHRAVQTAEAVRGKRDMPLRLEPQLMETDFGALDGMDWLAAKKQYPRECQEWIRRPASFRAPGAAESVRDVWVRVFTAFLRILRENRGGTVAIVAHGMVFSLLTAKLLGIKLKNYRLLPMLSNAAYRVLRVEDDGHVCLNEWEHNGHLEPAWQLHPRHLRKRVRRARRGIPRRAFCLPLKMTKKEKKQYGV